jgi:hypothetical protein
VTAYVIRRGLRPATIVRLAAGWGYYRE